jgi:hypothetical protein
MVRNGVGTKAAPWMTAAQPAHGQPTAAGRTVAVQGDGGVLRAAREIPARRRPTSARHLVQADEPDQKSGWSGGLGRPGCLAGCRLRWVSLGPLAPGGDGGCHYDE